MTKFMFLISLLFLGILLSAGDKLDGKNPSGRPGRRTPPRPTQPPPSSPPRPTQPPPLVTPPRPTPSPSRPTQPPPSPPQRSTQSPPSPPPQPTQPPPLVTPPSPTPSSPSPSHPPNLPYYVLSLTWPNTFCGQQTCNPLPPPEQFTIHGLWPQQKINIPRQSVRPNMDFTNTVSTFEQDLLIYWPNLINANDRESNQKFWRHEWEDHGKYSNMAESTYFSLTMRLLEIYHPLPMLESEGVQANGGSYQKAHILLALQNGLENHVADISCVPDGAGNYQLSEVHICFGKNIILMNCTSGNLAKSCPDRDVIFP